MIKQNFNAGWEISYPLGILTMEDGKGFLPGKAVHLPHDYMILTERSADVTGGFGSGYFETSDMDYVKQFEAPADWAGKKVWVEFEGAYSNAVVYLNGHYLGKRPFGYSQFCMDLTRYLKPGEINKLKIAIKNGTGMNSRWYSGAGIYRNVNLYVTDYTYIQLDGVKISTPSIDPDVAEVLVNTSVVSEDRGYRELRILTELYDAGGNKLAWDSTPVTIGTMETLLVRQRMYVDDPRLWSLEDPNLYYCETKLISDDRVLDETRNHFGIRKLQFDTKYGFRLNGTPIKLRGGCFHHDNGVIGACAFDRAEERKVELHKAAGYNALRSSHNPTSRALLDACDRLGMLVMDEAFDVWNVSKTDHDYSLFFEEWWAKDLQAMVDKDFNHPSVILYSTGNEIPERNGSSAGAAWSRKLAEFVRSIDPTRAVSNSLCGVNGPIEYAFDDMLKDMAKIMQKLKDQYEGAASGSEGVNSTEVNAYFDLTEEYASTVDVMGYNYLHNRWENDVKRYPNRLICGTESMPSQIADIWRLVRKHPAILGDFAWTSMDYIGETGCGKIDYSNKSSASIFGAWPWILAYCGDIDLIGTRRPQSYYREIVWGLRKDPYIAVSRPERNGHKPAVTAWSWTDVIESWSFPGHEGTPVTAEIYADADEVELLSNGVSLGKRPAGDKANFKVIFETNYEPGELLAIAYTGGIESGRMALRTAGTPKAIRIEADRTIINAGAEDLSYLTISFSDERGAFVPFMNQKVKVTVKGAGSLQGSGSGNPVTDENYYDDITTTFDGRMLAVIRSGQYSGKIEVIAESEGFDPVSIELICQ